MKPEKIGRIAGIGLRLAGKIAGEKLAGQAQTAHEAHAATPTPVSTPTARPIASTAKPAGRSAGQMTRGMAQGVRGFLRPFHRVGGIIWLEVTGVFFLLFVVVFAPLAWRTHPASIHGPYDRTFITSVVLIAVFLYLSISSFVRARRK